MAITVADGARKLTTFFLAVFLWLHAVLFLEFQSTLVTKLSGLIKLTTSEVVLFSLLVTFSLLAGSGFWRMVLSILYIYFFPFILFWYLLRTLVLLLCLTNAWFNAQRGRPPVTATITIQAVTAAPPPLTASNANTAPKKKNETLWRYLLRPFQKFTILWCLLLLVTTHRWILSVCLAVVAAQLARKIFFVLKLLFFSDAWWQKYRHLIFASLQKHLQALDALTPDVGPSNELKSLFNQLNLWDKILRFLSDPYLMSRWGVLITVVIFGTIYAYFGLLFSFVYHSLAYLFGVSFAWADAIVTSEFMPFLITDLPKVAIIRLVGGIHCALIVTIGVGTVVSFFRRKLDDIRRGAEDMSKRFADQSVREKYLILEQKASTPVTAPPKV
jgi:hypothetical protein